MIIYLEKIAETAKRNPNRSVHVRSKRATVHFDIVFQIPGNPYLTVFFKRHVFNCRAVYIQYLVFI